VKRFFIACIRFYQRHISPLFPGACRYSPTCSEYAVQAIERFGAFKGTALAVWRILRCNPFGGHGYDPVPEKTEKKKSRHDQGNKNE